MQIEKVMTQYQIAKNHDGVIVGFSGGADSVCLLTLMAKWCAKENLSMTAVHVNHGLRKEAIQDEQFCIQLCKEKGIALSVAHVDVKQMAKKLHMTQEEAGRMLRYECFAKEARKAGYKKPVIAVAHHQNDQAETVLFMLCRGSMLRGLGGMRIYEQGILRPLLSYSKEDILAYCDQERLGYCIDATNADCDYTRNAIRHEIVPVLMQKVNAKTVEHISATASHLWEAEAYIEGQTNQVMSRCVSRWENGYLLRNLEKEEPYLAGRVIYQVITQALGSRKDVTQTHVMRVRGLLDETVQAGRVIEIKDGLCARKESDAILITKKDTTADCVTGSLLTQILPWTKSDTISNEVYTKYMDYDKIKGDLLLRYPREGDYLILDEAGHKKKLNRYFIDAKVPARMRARILVVADGSHVVWIVGDRISAGVRIDSHTHTVYCVEYHEEE